MPNILSNRYSKTLNNLLTSVIAWGWPVLLSFYSTPLILKSLGPEEYGIRTLITSIIGYFALLDIGLNGAITKYLANYNFFKNNKKISDLLNTSLITFLVLGFLGFIIIWSISDWLVFSIFKIPLSLQSQSILAIKLSGFGFLLSMITWWCSSIPTGLQRFDHFNGVSIFYGTLTTILTLIAIKLEFGLIGIIVANLIANIISIFGYLISIKSLLPNYKIKLQFNNTMFKRTFSFGIYMIAFRLIGVISGNLDTILIGSYLNSTKVTYYNIPHQISSIVHSISAKLMQVIFPLTSELVAERNEQKIKEIFYKFYLLNLIIGITIIMPLIIGSKLILKLWISDQVSEYSSTVLIILTLGFFMYSFTALTTSYLGGLNKPKTVVLGTFVTNITSFTLYFLFIKKYEIIGAAFSKSFGMFLTFIYYIITCKIYANLSYKKLFFISTKPLILFLTISFSIFFLINSIESIVIKFLLIISSSIIFILAAWFINIIEESDKKIAFSYYRSLLSIIRNKNESKN